MKKISPYVVQQNINFIIGCFGIIGLFAFCFNLLFDWGINNIGLALYPIFLVNFYQYFKFKKKYIALYEDKIEWNLMGSEEVKSIPIVKGETKLEPNWKGLVVTVQEKVYEISFDGIWKKDRKRVYQEIADFYD